MAAAPPIPPDLEQRFRQEEITGDRPMTLIEHLLELRRRLVVSAMAVAIGTGVGLAITNRYLFPLLEHPAREKAGQLDLIRLDVLDGVTVYFKVALTAGIILAMPIIIYEALMFVVPALTPRERRWVLPSIAGIFLFFLTGVAFGYFVALPPALKFLIQFGPGKATIQVGRYFGFVTRMLLFIGLAFETPMVMLALSRFGVVSAGRMLRWWRYAIVMAFVLAALITPTIDPVTQTLVAGPIIVLYLLGIVLSKVFGRKPRPAAQQAPAAESH